VPGGGFSPQQLALLGWSLARMGGKDELKLLVEAHPWGVPWRVLPERPKGCHGLLVLWLAKGNNGDF